jgi:hypothetical protein
VDRLLPAGGPGYACLDHMRGRAFRFASMTLLLAAVVACGSRTGLFLDEDAFGPNPIDGGPRSR